MSLKRTPLYTAHQQAGARLVDFGGWEMPVQYTGIVAEHRSVREAAGIFDISHMGEVTVSGPAAKDFLNRLLTNDIARLFPGQGQYTLMCNEAGGTVDDLYAYRTGAHEYLLVINAARIDADLAWMRSQRDAFAEKDGVELNDQSDNMAAVAIQGPNSAPLLDQLFPGPSITETRVDRPSDLRKNELGRFLFGTDEVWVSHTGYTGEDGFEVITPADAIVPFWQKALALGTAFNLQPAGLGARDTLRTEMCYPLYGHELDEQTSPIEAGLGFFVALDKPDFNGRPTLLEQKQNGTERKLIAFKMSGKSAPPRPHYGIFAGDQRIGETTSGTLSPSLNTGIGMGFVEAEHARPNTPIAIEIRNRRFPAIIVRKPIYKRPLEG